MISRDVWSLKAFRSSSAKNGLIRTETPCEEIAIIVCDLDVAGHHDGRYVPAKGAPQVIDRLHTIR